MTTGDHLATSRWTWTDEERAAVYRVFADWAGEDPATTDYEADAVLAALAPHVARQLTELKRDNDDYHADLVRVMWERRAAEDEAAWLRAKLSERGGE